MRRAWDCGSTSTSRGVLSQHSRSQLQRLIKEGAVTVDGRGSKPNASVRESERIVVEIPEAAPAVPVAQDIELPIVYQDDDVIVVNKPAGMVVPPAAGHDDGTLVNALLFHAENLSGVGGEQRPGIVHRLDRGTSGLVVAAKNDLAHRELARQFHDREGREGIHRARLGRGARGTTNRSGDRPRPGPSGEDDDPTRASFENGRDSDHRVTRPAWG